MAQLKDLSRALNSGRVIARFGMRMAILLAFAAFGGHDFGRSLAVLLWMSIILSAMLATIRHERPFSNVLNYWDEAAAYIAMCCLVTSFNQAAAV